ncbi:unnamed protein product [Pieris brassicae]|uniref:Cysteine-rich PDZ-binding protein n=1 Tax=Pieris brassicae TaxID=7116 RepID=A0A9P0TXL4_PIEBR|nr:unnamed protein product [Pieris brassicae]
MVCEKCEKKLGRVITPDPWKTGARNTVESGGRKVGENKALTAKKGRYNPYTSKFHECKICRTKVHQVGSHYCQACAYKKGICAMCGKKILETANYRQKALKLKNFNEKYRTLLSSLVDVNEERMKTLNIILQLDNINYADLLHAQPENEQDTAQDESHSEENFIQRKNPLRYRDSSDSDSFFIKEPTIYGPNDSIPMENARIRCVYACRNAYRSHICDAGIYLKPVDLSDIDATENIDNLLLAVAPDDLRTELSSNDIEPYKSLPKRYNRSNDSLEFLGGLPLGTKQVEMLRRSWRDSCNRKAAKLCRKACVSTYKIVCGAYLCKRGMKRSFKKECKRNCRGRFASGSRSDTE